LRRGTTFPDFPDHEYNSSEGTMILIYKGSPNPISPWGALRHGGPNNLDAGIRGRYLVLFDVDIVHRAGAWHYIFQFDARDSLELSALAHIVGKEKPYPNDMDWKQWLGGATGGWQVISTKVREAILNMPADEVRTEAVITDIRPIPGGRPTPGRGPENAYQPELPRNVLLAAPDSV
jgi:hypothetical protein